MLYLFFLSGLARRLALLPVWLSFDQSIQLAKAVWTPQLLLAGRRGCSVAFIVHFLALVTAQRDWAASTSHRGQVLGVGMLLAALTGQIR